MTELEKLNLVGFIFCALGFWSAKDSSWPFYLFATVLSGFFFISGG